MLGELIGIVGSERLGTGITLDGPARVAGGRLAFGHEQDLAPIAATHARGRSAERHHPVAVATGHLALVLGAGAIAPKPELHVAAGLSEEHADHGRHPKKKTPASPGVRG